MSDDDDTYEQPAPVPPRRAPATQREAKLLPPPLSTWEEYFPGGPAAPARSAPPPPSAMKVPPRPQVRRDRATVGEDYAGEIGPSSPASMPRAPAPRVAAVRQRARLEEEDPFFPYEVRRVEEEDVDVAVVRTPEPEHSRVPRPGYYKGTNRLIKVTRWIFTAWEEPWITSGIPDEIRETVPPGVQFLCGQPEWNKTLEPDGRRRAHFQGYVEMKTPSTLREVAYALGLQYDKNYFAAAGTQDSKRAIDYTKKPDTARRDETDQSQWASVGAASARHVNEQYGALMDYLQTPGATFGGATGAFPGFAIRNSASIQKILSDTQVAQDRPRCEVFFLYGKSGTGKSTAIRQLEENAAMTVYSKMNDKDAARWWDGYKGQNVVLFDELRDYHYPITTLLRYLDHWALTVEIKGSTVPARWTRVYITANVPLEEWYKSTDENTREALFRRIPIENRLRMVKFVDGKYNNFDELVDAQRAVELEMIAERRNARK